MNVKLYSERLKEAAFRDGFQLAWYGKVEDTALPVLERKSSDDAPQVYISSGVHGNEPAGPMAVLDLIRRKSLPGSLNLTIFPLINPTGLMAGTRENREGIDLNRDYGLQPKAYETQAQLQWIAQRQFDLSFCLHEDEDGEGFYIYSHVHESSPHDYVDLALSAARPLTGIDQRELIDDMPAREGRMMPPEAVLNAAREDMPEALRLHFQHGSRYTFTTETPSRQPAEQRIRAQCAVIEVILKTYLSEEGPVGDDGSTRGLP